MFEGCKIVMLDYVPIAQRNKRKSTGPYYWTPSAPVEGKHPGRGFYQSMHGMRMDERGSTLRLRIELAGKSRYYVDETDTTYLPIIARLPSGRGFLSGWTMGEGMLASLDGHVWDDEDDARDDAQHEAEKAAENEADYLRSGPTAPSAWASYLINGDASGISDEDKAAADAWIERIGKGMPHSCYDVGFMRYHDAADEAPYSADCQSYHFD